MGPIKLLNRLIHKLADMTMFKIVGNDYTYLYNVSWVIVEECLSCGPSCHLSLRSWIPRRRIHASITQFANALQKTMLLQLLQLV
jgi:hypothetical protein